MKYKISIIIPVYNAAEYIVEKTLKSIENQTMDFNNIEVVLVNDCSSDNTEDVINNYASTHENILPIHLRKNAGGPAIPRNIGITYANADYLMFLDQDDVFRPNACETLYNKIHEEQVDMVCGNHVMVNNGNSHLCFNFKWAQKDEIKIDKIEDNPNFLTMGVAAWSKIFKREFVIENNLKFTEGVGEDIFFSIRGLLNAKGIILLKNFVVVEYNVRNESLSHQINKEYMIEFAEFYLKFYEYCDKYVDSKLYPPLFNSRMNNILSALFYSDLYFDELSEVLLKIQELFIKLNDKSFIFYDKKYQLFFNSIITDEFPFENSIMNYSSIKNFREGKTDKGIKYLKQSGKIYIDTGNGYSEKDSITSEYMISELNTLFFDLSKYNNIKRIRFDPISWFFIKCKIENIESNVDELNALATNPLDTHLEDDIFLTIDSQYEIIGDLSNIDYIKIKFKVDLLDNAQITSLIKKIK